MSGQMVVHVGFGKTGSSSLQAYLSKVIDVKGVDRQYKYCCIDSQGNVLTDHALSTKAGINALGYEISSPEICSIADLSTTRRALESIWEQGFVPILSQEDWARRAGEFYAADFWKRLGVKVHVVAYVRPQVEWMNSAWWQWFAWEKDFFSVRDVTNAWGLNFLKWGAQLSNWKNMGGVESVSVRLQARDIVSDFVIGELGGEVDARVGVSRANVSLPPMLVKAMMLNKRLRRNLGSKVDAKLSRLVQSREKTPWVIDREYASYLLEHLRKDNVELSDFLCERDKQLFFDSPRWWKLDAYNDDFERLLSSFDLSDAEKDALIAKLIEQLVNVDER